MGKDQDLLEACRTGNVSVVEKLLSGRLGNKSRTKGAGALSSFSKSILSLKCANVNCVDASGDTPLHLAALNGHKAIVTILLECDASPNVLDSRDCSPLHLAAWSGHTEICNQLLLSPDGQSLINLQTRDGNTALHFAAQHGHNSCLSLLLQKKGDPTVRNLEDLSPLDLAAQYDRLELVKQLVTSHPELLVHSPDCNQTPLHLASRCGHRPVVQYLLDSGFPIDAKTDKGTALHEAANFCKLDVIKLLLERGVDITVKSHRGSTAEDILNSIPSKTAEDALGILKSHIYHQRTPDSDGEKGILDLPTQEAATPIPRVEIEQNSPVTIRALSAKKPSSLHGPDRVAQLHTSLPANQDSSAPPPIPPRLSIRESVKQEAHGAPPGLPPPRGSTNLSRDKGGGGKEEMQAGLSASAKGTGSRETSPANRTPSMERPKKPPRKKPASFRKTEETSCSSTEERTLSVDASSAACSRNYINIDPYVEKTRLDSDGPIVSSELDDDGAKSVITAGDSKPKEQEYLSKPDEQDETNCYSLAKDIPMVVKTQPSVSDNQDGDGTASKPLPPQTLSIEHHDSDQAAIMPTSPSKIVQPPTPDCPPPSPSTAILDIQKKIQPMEKRRSQDVETLTDLTEDGAPISPRPRSSEYQEGQGDVGEDKLLTPVTEEGLLAGGKPLKPPQTRPKPRPRKSSLSSQSTDSSAIVSDGAAARNNDRESSPSLQGYGGATPASSVQGKVLRKQDQVKNESVDEKATEEDVIPPVVEVDAPMANTVDVDGETVQLRRSCSSSTDSDWQGHVFADLLRGSVVGGARDIADQLSGNINNNNNNNNNVPAASQRNKKRKSTASNFVTFDPVMEEDKDVDPSKVLSEIDNIVAATPSFDNNNDVFDDESEWDQIAKIISSYGGRISSSGDFALFEAQIDRLLASKAESKLQSVGEWLTTVGLAQYENAMVANGFDDTDFLSGTIMEDQDLNAIGVSNPDHRRTIVEAATQLMPLQPIEPNNLPNSVAEWLGSLRLDFYQETFTAHKYDTMERVIQLWELELVTVLDISSIGHRKRILASLGEWRPEPANTNTRVRLPSLDTLVSTKSPFDNVDLYRDYTGVRSRVPSKGQESEATQGSQDEMTSTTQPSLERGQSIQDSSVHIRAPHMVQYTGSIKQWRHKPEVLIKGCCNYTAHYLGSTLVKELKGPISTQEGIAKLKKSSEVISKIPSIMLSISFKGVKFIDALSKKVVCDHEITNIFCACQDAEHMNFFAYITKDRDACKCYCHVFSVRSKELAGEIILTLGQAFEIAYQMVLKEKAQKEADDFEKMGSSVTTSEGDIDGDGAEGDGEDSTSVSSKTSTNTL